jgi:hypothetical protein
MNVLKRAVVLTVILLLLTVTALTLSTPNARAAEVETYMKIAVSPNPAGVGQTVYVLFWLTVYPPTAAGPGGDRWRDLTVTVTKPDGTTETKGPFTSDPVGGRYLIYTPDQVGTYTFQAHFPGQTLQAGENP